VLAKKARAAYATRPGLAGLTRRPRGADDDVSVPAKGMPGKSALPVKLKKYPGNISAYKFTTIFLTVRDGRRIFFSPLVHAVFSHH